MNRLLLAPLLLAGCSPLGLGGSIDGAELAFAEVLYIEQAGTDPGSQQPFHDLDLWLMPVEDSCSVFTNLLLDLEALRTRMQTDGLDPTDYCNEWESTFQEAFGPEDFWMANMRLKALPRAEGEEVTTKYTYWDDAQAKMAAGPNFDGEVARYAAPTFDACSAEFTGDAAEYGPTVFEVDGGEANVTEYTPTESVTVELAPTVQSQGDEALTATSTAAPCLAALDWPLSFGLGIPDL